MLDRSRILFVVIGSDGFLASNLIQELTKFYNKEQIIEIDKQFFRQGRVRELADADSCIRRIREVGSPAYDKVVVVNLISAANVDWCEKYFTESNLINYEFPRYLFENLKSDERITFVSFSSNAVYSGEVGGYDELSSFGPINAYGYQKSQLDCFVRSELKKYILIRPTTLFGNVPRGCRSNPLIDLCRSALFGRSLTLVDDLRVNFGSVQELASCIIDWSESDLENLEVNFGGPDVFSRYELGHYIYGVFGKSLDLIAPCRTAEFPSVAQRPLNTSFNCAKLVAITMRKRISIRDFVSQNYSLQAKSDA